MLYMLMSLIDYVSFPETRGHNRVGAVALIGGWKYISVLYCTVKVIYTHNIERSLVFINPAGSIGPENQIKNCCMVAFRSCRLVCSDFPYLTSFCSGVRKVPKKSLSFSVSVRATLCLLHYGSSTNSVSLRNHRSFSVTHISFLGTFPHLPEGKQLTNSYTFIKRFVRYSYKCFVNKCIVFMDVKETIIRRSTAVVAAL